MRNFRNYLKLNGPYVKRIETKREVRACEIIKLNKEEKRRQDHEVTVN